MILRVEFTVRASGLLPMSLLMLNPTSERNVDADDKAAATMPASRNPPNSSGTMVFEAQTLSAKLAGALDGLARERDVEPGFVVACLKRALQYVNRSFGASQSVSARKVVGEKAMAHFRTELLAIREEMLRLMSEYRQKQW